MMVEFFQYTIFSAILLEYSSNIHVLLDSCAFTPIFLHFNLKFDNISMKSTSKNKSSSIPELVVKPIGIIHTPYLEKYHAPRQPGAGNEISEGVITLLPHQNFEQALEYLDGFERIWILSWFDRNKDWKPKVLPPRSGRTKRGVFSTRSPHRPNPIGLSLCKLLGIEGLTLRVENPDMLDGTPILDIKPYIPYAEAFPDSRTGWLESLPADTRFAVVVSKLALVQSRWLDTKHDIHFLEHVIDTISRDPFPHSFRRIKKSENGGFVMGAKSWRVFYNLKDSKIEIEKIESGYPPEALERARKENVQLHNEKAHREFQKKWM
jgi:tRNA (adenine37-N6)-methyltransferase